MNGDREDRFRRNLLLGAMACWMAAITFCALILAGPVESGKGWGQVTNMFLALAITFTVIWSQFRIRRIIVSIFNAGMQASRACEHCDLRRDKDSTD